MMTCLLLNNADLHSNQNFEPHLFGIRLCLASRTASCRRYHATLTNGLSAPTFLVGGTPPRTKIGNLVMGSPHQDLVWGLATRYYAPLLSTNELAGRVCCSVLQNRAWPARWPLKNTHTNTHTHKNTRTHTLLSFFERGYS